AELLAQHARHLAALGRLAHAGAAEHQDALAGLHHVAHDVNRAVDGAPDAAGEADDAPAAVADRGDPVQRALDAGAVVLPELTHAGGDVLQVVVVHKAVGQVEDALWIACLGLPAEIEDDLEQILRVVLILDRV